MTRLTRRHALPDKADILLSDKKRFTSRLFAAFCPGTDLVMIDECVATNQQPYMEGTQMIFRFVAEYSQHSDLRREFASDPNGVLDRYDIPETERQHLLAGDRERVARQ